MSSGYQIISGQPCHSFTSQGHTMIYNTHSIDETSLILGIAVSASLFLILAAREIWLLVRKNRMERV